MRAGGVDCARNLLLPSLDGMLTPITAVVYVRAPSKRTPALRELTMCTEAFKDRYFLFLQNSQNRAGRSQTSLAIARSPSPSPFSTTPPFPNGTSVRNTPSPSYLAAARSSSLSVDTIESDGTLRAPTLNTGGDGILKLGQDDPPEMFRAQLEWLYTGEGFGDVVEWISGDGAAGPGGAGNLRDSLGRRGNLAERRDKLGNDLTYMWTSKLYCDVRIHLDAPESDGYGSDTSGDSDDSLAETVIFTAHRFMLVSRSPYFASVLLNPSSFRPATADVHLPTPPFTPAALHFCLGWIYAGHLDFSNRSFDLSTALQIHRAAAYLQLDSLVSEVESRLVYDFCDNMDWDRCHCRRCLSRVPRVWRFTCAPDVGALDLHKRARRFMIAGWTEAWGREVGSADKKDRDDLVRDLARTLTPGSVISVFRGVARLRRRMSQAIRSKGPDAAGWTDAVGEMVEQIEKRARDLIATHFVAVCESKELWDALNGVGMNEDALDAVLAEMVEIAGRPTTSVEAPRMYQTIVSSLLLKVNPDTLQPMLRTGSQARHKVEQTKEGVLSHIRRRWMGIKDAAGFVGLEPWSLKEISDELDLPMDDLLGVAFPRSSAGFPRTASTAAGLAESNSSTGGSRAASRADRQSRSSVDQASEISSGSQTSQGPGHANRASVSTLRGVETPEPSERNGLRRLRLSSSASSASVTSSRAASRAAAASQSSRQTPTSSGPTPRSPTAASKTLVVSVGSRNRVSPSLGSPNSPTPTVMSGPPRPLLTGKRPVSKLKSDNEKTGDSPSPRAGPSTLRHQSSMSSVRSTPSAKTPTAARTPTTRAVVSSRTVTSSNASAKSTARPTPANKSPTKAVSKSPTKAASSSRPSLSSTRPSARLRTVSTPNAAAAGAKTATPNTRPISHSRTSSVASASTASSAARAAATVPASHSRTSSVSSSTAVRPMTAARPSRASSTASVSARPAPGRATTGSSSSSATHSRNASVTSAASSARTPLTGGPPARLTRDSAHSRNGSLASLRSFKSAKSTESATATPKPTPRSGMTKSASMMSVRSTRSTTKPAETPKPATSRASTGSTAPSSELKTFRTRSVSMANLKTTTPTPRSSLPPSTTSKTPAATPKPGTSTLRPRPSTASSTRVRTNSTASSTATGTGTRVRPRTSSLASTRSHATIAEDPDQPPLPGDAKDNVRATRTRTMSMASAASRASTSTAASGVEETTPATKTVRPRASVTAATPTPAARGKAAQPSTTLAPLTPTDAGSGKMARDQATPKAAAKPSAPSKAGTLRPSTSSRNISRSVSESTLKPSNSARSLSSKTSRDSGAVTPKASNAKASLEPATPTAPKQRSVSAKAATPNASGTPRRSTSGLSPATAGTPRQRAVSAGASLWKRATPVPPKVAGVVGQDNTSPRTSMSPRASNSPSASTVSGLKSASRGRLRSSSGSTEGPSEAITPRMSASVEPIIAQEQEDAACAPPLQNEPSPDSKSERPPSVLLHRPESLVVPEEPQEEERREDKPEERNEVTTPETEPPSGVTVTLNDEPDELDPRVTPRATRAERARATSESTTPTSAQYPPAVFGVPHRSASSPVSAISDQPIRPIIPPRTASITVSVTDDESDTRSRSGSGSAPLPIPGASMLSDEPVPTNLPPPSAYTTPKVPPTPPIASFSLPNTPPVRPTSLAASPMSAASLHSVLSTAHGSPAGSVRSHTSPYRPHPAHAFDPPPRERPAPVPVAVTPPKIEVTDENVPFSGRGVSLHVGIPCIVALTSRRARFRANAKYLGTLQDTKGQWVGIEVEDLDRFGIETLPTGARNGVRYFHFTVPSTPAPGPEARQAREMRLRRIGSIADSLPRRRLGALGLSNPSTRSASPFGGSSYAAEWVAPEKPRALFVRPEEVLFVMGADP